MGHSTLDCNSDIVASLEVSTARVSTGPNYQIADFWCNKHLCTTTAADTSTFGHFHSNCLDYGIYLRGTASQTRNGLDTKQLTTWVRKESSTSHSDYHYNSSSAIVSSLQFITHLYPFLLLFHELLMFIIPASVINLLGLLYYGRSRFGQLAITRLLGEKIRFWV